MGVELPNYDKVGWVAQSAERRRTGWEGLLSPVLQWLRVRRTRCPSPSRIGAIPPPLPRSERRSLRMSQLAARLRTSVHVSM